MKLTSLIIGAVAAVSIVGGGLPSQASTAPISKEMRELRDEQAKQDKLEIEIRKASAILHHIEARTETIQRDGLTELDPEKDALSIKLDQTRSEMTAAGCSDSEIETAQLKILDEAISNAN